MSRAAPRLAVAAAAAVAIPMLLLWRTAPPPAAPLAGGETVRPSPVPAETGAAERRLFLEPLDPAGAPEAADAPKLIGIAGRLPNDAVAMVRAADGTTRVLAVGQSHDGWTLATLSPDAALFTRGGRRVRSFLPAPAPEAPDDGVSESEAGDP